MDYPDREDRIVVLLRLNENLRSYNYFFCIRCISPSWMNVLLTFIRIRSKMLLAIGCTML
jgi:hypothetical protein